MLAVSPVGVAGNVIASLTFVYAESAPLLVARTR